MQTTQVRILIAEDETIIRLDLRDLLERAKGILMESEGLSESVAFARLRKASQATGRPLRVIAEAVIATFEAG